MISKTAAWALNVYVLPYVVQICQRQKGLPEKHDFGCCDGCNHCKHILKHQNIQTKQKILKSDKICPQYLLGKMLKLS